MATEFMNVRYIGPKERKRDTVNGTDTVWSGWGDVKSIPEAQGQNLVDNHPDVWQDVAKHPEPPERKEPDNPGGPTPTVAAPLPLNEAAIAVIIEPDGEDPAQFELVIGAMNDAIKEMGYVVTGMSNDGQNVAAVEIQSVSVGEDGNIEELLTYETIEALPDNRDQIEEWGKEYLGVDVDKRYGPKKLKAALMAVLDLREQCINEGTEATQEDVDAAMQQAVK